MAAGSSGPRGCTGSSWLASDTSKLTLYLARIFMRGRSFNHHCSLGIRCLRGDQAEQGWGSPSGPTPAPDLRRLLEVCLLLQLRHGLEQQCSLADSQYTHRVLT